jgi:hypothetical protein
MRRSLALLPGLALLVVACTKEIKAPPGITIELASVTLGDDCGLPPPPEPTRVAEAAKQAPAAMVQRASEEAPGAAMADCAGPDCSPSSYHACEQTSMQLAITTKPDARGIKLQVKKVELLDKEGKLLQELTASMPASWSDERYVAWDETLPGGVVRAMYRLGSPDWDKLTKGRWNAHSHTFQLRVTVAVGDGQTTIEKQAITPARVEPEIVT